MFSWLERNNCLVKLCYKLFLTYTVVVSPNFASRNNYCKYKNRRIEANPCFFYESGLSYRSVSIRMCNPATDESWSPDESIAITKALKRINYENIHMPNKEFIPPWDLFQPLNTDAFVVILEGFNRGFHRGSFAS